MAGFADFLSTMVEEGLGGAMGGRSRSARNVDAFNAQLPAIYKAFDDATTRDEIEKAARLFSEAWHRAGGPLDDKFDKFAERLTGTALNRVQRGELESISRDYGGQPAQPQPEGTEGPLTEQGAFVPPRPGRAPDLEFSQRMYQATGAKPQNFQEIFGTPSLIAERQGKADVEASKLREAEGKAKALEDLPSTPQPGGMISPRTMGAIYPAGLPQYEPQREPAGAALDLKRQGLDIQQQRANAILERIQQGSATAAERLELKKLGLDIQQQRLDLQKQGTVSEREAFDPNKVADAQLNLIAVAKARGVDKLPIAQQPAAIKQIGSELGLDIQGEPTMTTEGGLFGKFDLPGSKVVPRVTGITGATPRPTTITRRPGGQAPTGQPAPQGQPATQGGTVLMRAPDGSQRPVPIDRVEEFKRKGATVVGR